MQGNTFTREFMVKPPNNVCDSHLATLPASWLSLSRLKLRQHQKSICFVSEKTEVSDSTFTKVRANFAPVWFFGAIPFLP